MRHIVSRNGEAYQLYQYVIYFCRGKDFRREFGKLGDIRGYFPQRLKFMALTATASLQTRKDIIKLMGMCKPVAVIKSPDKPNIYYSVEEKNGEVEDSFCFLVERIRSLRIQMEKTIIFCRTYKDCSWLFFFRDTLEEEITDPVGFPDIAKIRLVDMFTACHTAALKDSILKSFSLPESRLRVVIATVAFGMGIDCSGVRHIIISLEST